ncbi:MAG TPA: hypothetical protein VEH06_03160 [Candidatus Bathyarchaeia archaeon]|nr:hypothetical protein [Candidatus Bathyarchaeia archaeon]
MDNILGYDYISYMRSQSVVLLVVIITLSCFCCLSASSLRRAHADILTNAATQRIGNYNIYMKTVPPNPIAGQNTQILFEISTVNGEQLIDQPIAINISKEGIREQTTHPVFVPYGHYSHEFVFKQPGIYALDISILNDPDTGENITFTFPVRIYDPFGEYFAFSASSSLPIGYTILFITAASAVIILVVSIKLRNKERRRKAFHHSGTA